MLLKCVGDAKLDIALISELGGLKPVAHCAGALGLVCTVATELGRLGIVGCSQPCGGKK
jgi:acid phosphatase family membrane protein YuiD